MGETTPFFGLDVPAWGALPIIFAVVLGIVLLWKNAAAYFEFIKKPAPKGYSNIDAFGGPIGAGFIMLFLPSYTYFQYYAINKSELVSFNPWSSEFLAFKANPLADGFGAFFSSVFSLKPFLFFAAWVVFHWILYLVVPGKVVEGTPLKEKSSTRLLYCLNALRCNAVAVLSLLGLIYLGVFPATAGYDNYVFLLTGSIVFSVTFAVLLYIWSRVSIPPPAPGVNPGDKEPLHMLSHTGNSGYLIYDLWMGRTLNPRIGFLDLKFVCELRPGLLLWALLNFSCAAKQYEQLGHITPAMGLVCLFQGYYVLDSWLNENAILTTMDITTDGFGYMLAFGDLTWVPFTYCLQARFLVDYPVDLSWPAIAVIVLLKIAGLYIFRSANSQKNTFRSNPSHPSVANLRSITTKTGRRLLADGWWGTSRHINYMGDLMMGLAWCLPTGFSSPLTYFYFFYFAALLVDRQIRDDQKCREQYGADWDRYCEMVPWRIVPYVY